MPSLEAQVEVRPTVAHRPEDVTALVSLTNRGPEPLQLNTVPLSSPSLALQIEDEREDPVLLPPPPVPRELVSLVELAPGERHSTEYRGFLPSWIPPGSYRVRLRYLAGRTDEESRAWSGEMTSDWAEFEIHS